MITIVEQTTAERKNETKDLFEQIKPYLDEGFSYKSALVKIGRISRGTNLNTRKGWYKHLIDYGNSMGYVYGDHIYRQEAKVGQVKTLSWDHLW